MEDWDYIEREIRQELANSSDVKQGNKKPASDHKHNLNESTSSNQLKLVPVEQEDPIKQSPKQQKRRYKEKCEAKEEAIDHKQNLRRRQPNKHKRQSPEHPPQTPVRIEKPRTSAKTNRRDYHIEYRYPPALQSEHIIHITTANNPEHTIQEIKRLMGSFNWILVQAFNRAIPFALEIVEQSIRQLNKREVHRINIPGTFKAEEFWDPKEPNLEALTRRLELPELRIELSFKPLIARHMGYQHYKVIEANEDYNRQRRRYRPKESAQ